MINSEIETWARIVRDAKIPVEDAGHVFGGREMKKVLAELVVGFVDRH